MKYWLLKSEPSEFSIDDLAKLPQQIGRWDGVRNYQARNFLRNECQVNDLAFFYHSNANPSGVIGIVKVAKAGYPDPSAFDTMSHYFDPKSQQSSPCWYCIDVQFVQRFSRLISLEELKTYTELKEMPLLRRGNRLSVQPVAPMAWKFICQLAKNSNVLIPPLEE